MARRKLSELMFQNMKNMKLTRGFILKPFAGQSHWACVAVIAQWSQDY